MKPIIKGIILQIIYVFLLTGCATEENVITPPSTTTKTEATLMLNIPEGGFEAPATKMLTESDESAIATVDVLVFQKDNATDPDEGATFLYRAETVTASDGKSFRMAIQKHDDCLQQYMVIANARSEVDGIEASLSTTMSKADVRELLVMAKTAAWNSTTGSYDKLPMWGETKFRKVTDAASATATIDLLRAVARVNVEVATAARADFTLTGVWLYNPSTKGQLAPEPTFWDETAQVVTAESLPTGGCSAGAAQSWTTMTETGIALKNTIYTFEAPASAGNTDENAACLIVAGKWNGEADAGYYRIDFYGGESGSEDFLPLLRNHRYDVQITEANGRGYPNRDEALKAGFTNLQAITHTWDDAETGNVIWDGRNYLSVSQTSFEFDPEARTFDLVIGSNYSEGWNVTLEGGGTWLTLNGSSDGTQSGAGDGDKHTLTYTMVENTTAERTATITVTAGRLKQTITVKQLLNKQLALELGDMEIIFKATDPVEQMLRIEWLPASTPVNISTATISGYTNLAFTGGNALPLTVADEDGNPDNGGGANLTFKPNAATLATFAERRTALQVKTDNGAGNMQQTVTLRQFDYALTVDGKQANDQYQQLTTYDLTIKSNAQWDVTVSDPEGVLKTYSNPSAVIGDPNYSTGEVFNFTMADESKKGKSATLTFNAREGLFSDVVVTVTMWKNEPNSYIVAPGELVEIPVSKVFDIWATDADLNDLSHGGDPSAMNGSLSTGLLWQDELALISTQPTLSGSGRDAKIRVQTAAKSGNAVVYLAVDGVIRWSWHIWVTTYNPDGLGATFVQPHNKAIVMDRNLGATSNTAPIDVNDISSLGLLYQWGRKDPFPGRSAMNLSVFNSKPIYAFDGTVLTEDTDPTGGTGVKRMPTTIDYNLANAIMNPLIFYYGQFYTDVGLRSANWYTGNGNSSYHRTDLWGPEYKSVYDPCPEGWRVPNESSSNIFYFVGLSSDWEDYKGGTFSMGFFPAAGGKTVTSSTSTGILSSATSSVTWLSDSRRANSASSTSVVGQSSNAANGFSIRCVKTTIK